MQLGIDLRDGGMIFGGFGVTRALAGVEAEIAPALIGQDATDQAAIDRATAANRQVIAESTISDWLPSMNLTWQVASDGAVTFGG